MIPEDVTGMDPELFRGKQSHVDFQLLTSAVAVP